MREIKLASKICVVLCILLFSFTGCSEDPDPVKYTAPVADFSIIDEEISIGKGETIVITAYPKPEGKGKVYNKWHVDDVLSSSTEELTYTFITPGVKIVKYVAKNAMGEFSKEFKITVTDTIEIELSVGDVTEITRYIDEELVVEAVVGSGSNIVHEWKVDGNVISNTSEPHKLDGFILDELRTYYVEYKGYNSAGVVEKAFSVKVEDRPIEVELTINGEEPTGANIKQDLGVELIFAATIKYGGAGATHSWKLNGIEKSTNSTYVMPCDLEGDFVVAYKCVNAKGETFEDTYTVAVVSEVGWIISDFEIYDRTTWRFTPGIDEALLSNYNNWTVSVADNPDNTGINKSSKCFMQNISNNAYTSGLIWLNFKRYTFTDDVSEYSRIRFKYYKDSEDRMVRVEYYDSSWQGATAVDGKDGRDAPLNTWVEVEFKFKKGAYDRLGIQTLRRIDTSKPGARPNNMAYIDDVELLAD